jgi:hypothetical protein
VFVRACGEGPCPESYRLEAYVISRLPQTMEVRLLTLRLEPWIIDSCKTHEWVAARLGLGCYPIQDRDIRRNPRSPLGLDRRPLRVFMP